MSAAPIDVAINGVQTASAQTPAIDRILRGQRIVFDQLRQNGRVKLAQERCSKCVPTQRLRTAAIIHGFALCEVHARRELSADADGG